MRICHLFIAILAAATALAGAAPFSTFLREDATISGLGTDRAGNIHVLGQVQESPIPGRGIDFFAIRLDPGATKVAYYQYFGGSGADEGVALAVDAAGNAYVAGTTYSNDFPVTNGSAASASVSRPLPFVMKLDPSGEVVFSSIYESQAIAQPQAIALDPAGNIVLTGVCGSNYPTTNGAFSAPSNGYFVTRLNPGGVTIMLSVVGAGGAYLAFGPQGEIYVSGSGGGASTPVTPGAYQTTFVPSFFCAFLCQLPFPTPQQYVSKLSADGSQLIYSTFLTGNGGAANEGLAVDSAGNAYVTGYTASSDFPYNDSVTAASRTGQFLAKLDPTGEHLVWAVRQGGSQLTTGANGNLAVAGYWGPQNTAEFSLNIVYPAPVPTANTPLPCLPNQVLARQNAFLQQFDPRDGNLIATQIYPATFVTPTALAATKDGRILMAGNSGLPDVPLTAGVVFTPRIARRAVSGAFLAAFDQDGAPLGGGLSCVLDALGNNIIGPIAPGEIIAVLGSGFGPASPVTGSITGPGSVPTSLGGIIVTFDGVPAPLAYVADNQINVSVPFEVGGGTSTLMQVTYNSGIVATRQFAVVPSNPTLFTDVTSLTQCGRGSTPGPLTLFALNSDGARNTCTNPARPGSTITLLLNAVNLFAGTPPATGTVLGPSPNPTGALVSVGTAGISLASGGLVPWPGLIAGVFQLSVTLPSNVSSSLFTFPIYVNINGLDAGPLIPSLPTPTPIQGLVWVAQ